MKRRNLIILLINMFTLTSCMRGDHMVAYFYSFDEESGCRYVQVSKKYLEYTVDEYHYKEDKYDGNIEININIPNEINGIPVTSMGGYNYKIKDKVTRYHDSATACDIYCRMPFAIIANDFFDKNCNLIINFYIPQNINKIYIGYFTMYSKCKGEERYQYNYVLNFKVDENNQYFYSKNGSAFYKKDDSDVLRYDRGSSMKEDEIIIKDKASLYIIK